MSERDIFMALLDLPTAAERAQYLDAACGSDADLRARVENLLSSHEAAGSFLDLTPTSPSGPDHAATRALAPDLEGADTRTGGTLGAADDEVPLGFLAPATRPDSLGRIGHYEVLQLLGQGGFGIVFRAFDDVLHRVVAVKVLSPQMAATSPARKRFLREARSSAQVRHENVVQVYEVGETPLPYIAMEFIPGETLQQRLTRVGPVDPAEVVRVGRQVAEGLAAAHATDLIHRDIKPGNILLEGGAGRVKITDFGLARAADDASISQSGIIAGTPMFMAPEQAKGDKLDQRADLFSLGSVLYQMTSGRPPFRANSTVAVLKRVAEDTPRDIREIIPETPQWLCNIIGKLHEKKPEDRFQTAREVADVLADCEAQLKAHTRLKDYSRIPRGKVRPSGRRKWVAAAAVLLLPVVVLAVTESAGVTQLFRGQRAMTDPIKPGDGAPPPLAVAPFDAAQAEKHQKAWAEHLGVPVEFANSIGMKFRLIPPSEFSMGTADGDPKATTSSVVGGVNPRSEPRHLVRITAAYFAGVHEVTNEQFRKYIEATRGTTDAESSQLGAWQWSRAESKLVRRPELTWRTTGHTADERLPVTCVTAQDAARFCEWLSKEEGRTYRLPTEAEWENMCRAGTTTPFAYGPQLARAQAVFSADAPEIVGTRPANAFGLCDMHGNASEWCADGPREYAVAETSDPYGPRGNSRVMRGGDFDSNLLIQATLQSSGRASRALDYSSWGTGFRVVMVDVVPRTGAAEAAKPEPLPPAYTNGLGMEFVKVPKGKAWLGGGKDKLGDQEVVIPADFYLGKYEVTQEEWEKVMGENPSHFSRRGKGADAVKDISDADLKRFPVECITWDQCQIFVAKLNQQMKESGWVYRLPTEMEWEYACRGGPMADKLDSAFDFYFARPTNALLPGQANCNQALDRSCKVGSYPPNGLALFDMHGNLFEWCEEAKPGTDEPSRRARGGGWYWQNSVPCRAGHSSERTRSERVHTLGLRLARIPSGVPSTAPKTPPVVADEFKDAVLVMSFEKDTFYQKDGKTYARDLSGNGNDGLCDNVAFTPDGKAGGGLLCQEGEGRLQLAKSLILRQPNYTITAWCRWDTRIDPGTGKALYRTCLPDRLTQSVFDIGIPLERSVHVNAWNGNLLPKYWKNARTGSRAVPAGWFFVAVSLTDGEIDNGKLRIVIDDKILSRTSQMVATGNPVVDFIGHNMAGAVIDELAVFQRALSDEEIAAVRAMGLKGSPWNVGNVPLTVAPFTDADVQRIAALPAEQQVEEVRKELMRRNPGFDGTVGHKIEDGVVTDFRIVTDTVTDIAPIQVFKALRALDCSGTWTNKSNGLLADLTPLKAMNLAALTHLGLACTKVTDAGMVYFKDCKYLKSLRLDGTTVTDAGLAQFKDCRDLTFLRLDATRVTDTGLAQFKDCKDLTYLNLSWTKVSDVGLAHFKDCKDLRSLFLCATKVDDAGLAPFKGMPLRLLWIDYTGITDLNGLQGMPLEDVRLTPKNITKGLKLLRDMKGPRTIGISELKAWPAAEFWERYDKGEFGLPPFTDADVKRIAALPAAEQVEEVRKELVRHNPGFDGKVEHKIEDGVVAELRIHADRVTDISPIRVFHSLRVLACTGTAFRSEKAPLADLTALTGMNFAMLTQLDLSGTSVGDAGLAHFQGCKKLTSLNLRGTQVSDAGLAHFKDCKNLTSLNLGWTRISDAGLAHLSDCKHLKMLSLNWAADVTDAGLAHFKSCQDLAVLIIDHTKITDLSLLKGMSLQELSFDFQAERDTDLLRSMKTLEQINGKPAAEFWKDVEKN